MSRLPLRVKCGAVGPTLQSGVIRGAGVPRLPFKNMVTSKKTLKRQHHLPHWQLGGSVYFITFRSVRGPLLESCMRQVIENVLFDNGKRYELFFGVVLPDHVHLLLKPLPKRDRSINANGRPDTLVGHNGNGRPDTLVGHNGNGRPDTLVGRHSRGRSAPPTITGDARGRSVPPTIADDVRGKSARPTVEYFDLSEIMKGIKGASARQINRILDTTGKIWQEESYDRIIRDENEFMEKLNYMYNNPVAAGLVDDPEEYKFYIRAENKNKR